MGNDRIDAGEGNDFVRGDVVNFAASAVGGGHDVLYLGPGDDNSLGDSVGLIASGGGNDYISGDDGLDGVIGDSIAFAGDATGGGNDVLDGGLGPDFVLGDSEAFVGRAIAAGNDTVIGSGGDDLGLVGDNLSAGAVTSAGHDAVDGGDGNDRLFGDNVDTTWKATFGSAGGNDVLDAGDGADFLRAGPGTTSSTADSVVRMTATARPGPTARQAARSSPASRSRGLTSREWSAEEVPLMWAVTKRRWPPRAPRDPPAGSALSDVMFKRCSAAAGCGRRRHAAHPCPAVT